MQDKPKPIIYLAGYGQSNTLETLKKKAESLNAIIVDLRHCPISKRKEWDRSTLRFSLAGRYLYLGLLWGASQNGTGALKVFDFERGLKTLNAKLEDPTAFELSPEAVILLCSCRALTACHRGLLGNLLASQGYKVRTLVWKKTILQRRLIDLI